MTIDTYDISSLRILIAEDSKFMANLLETMLKVFGSSRIKTVSTRQAFIDRLQTFKPDLILTDWKMQEFSGRNVADIVRKSTIAHTPFIPIIAISGHTEEERINEMLHHGVDDVIQKPVATKELYARITRLIRNPPQYVKSDHYLGPERNLQYLAGEHRVMNRLTGSVDEVYRV